MNSRFYNKNHDRKIRIMRIGLVFIFSTMVEVFPA